jgi:hypothetical protein
MNVLSKFVRSIATAASTNGAPARAIEYGVDGPSHVLRELADVGEFGTLENQGAVIAGEALCQPQLS